jgi:hypothetical protein
VSDIRLVTLGPGSLVDGDDRKRVPGDHADARLPGED